MTGFFPAHPLAVTVEIDVNGTWTDITSYVYQRSDISISPFSRTNETSSMQPAQMTLTLNNRDGRFTPNNASGAYYPYVQLNTQLRLSVDDESSDSTTYSGYRFWGEVSEWPPQWDNTGKDVYALITVSGIWRRLSQSTATLGSPFTRWNTQLGDSYTIAGYWPMEDGSGSTDFAAVAGSADAMTIVSGTPTLSSVSAFPGSDAIPQLNGSELSGVITTSDSPTEVVWRFCLFVQSGGDTGVAAGPLARIHLGSNTSLSYVDVSLAAAGGGPFTITGYNSSGVAKFTGTLSVAIWGIPIMVQVGLVKSGSNVVWSLNLILPGTTTWYGTVTGTYTSASLADASSVIFSPGATYKGVAVGQSIVLYDNPSILEDASALSGWTGENALTRFERICTEEGIAYEAIGTSATTMGPQLDGTLTSILQAVEDTDGGLIYESQDQFGLGYRTQASLIDQSAALTVSYSSAQLAGSLTPVNDDALTRNDVTLTNYDGYSVRVFLANGARSILAPPNGAGTGYTYTRSVSSTSHSQVDDLGSQILNAGCTFQNRYPTVTVDLSRSEAASLFSDVPSMRVGDYLQVTSMPSFMGGGTEKQLAWGWTETINAFSWTIAFNTVPEAPWESSFNPGTSVSGQVPGSPTTQGTAGSVTSAQIAEGAIVGKNIAAAAVNGSQIASATITADNIVAATITGTLIGVGTITGGAGGNIASATITGSNIGTGQITGGSGGNIASATITGSNIGTGTITGGSGGNIASATITGAQIASATITGGAGGNIASGTIQAGQIQAATITSSQISATAGITGSQLSSSANIQGGQIGSLQITNAQIANGTITNSQINSAANIAGSQLANSTITNIQIANGTITTTQISGSANITGTQIASNTITTGNIAANTITASNIAAGAITTTQIAANTIQAGNILAATITTAQIAANTITGGNVAASTITATNMAANSITAGMVVAGAIDGQVINGVTINGATINATSGGVFTYSNTGTVLNANPDFATNITNWTAIGGAISYTTPTINSHDTMKLLLSSGPSGMALVYTGEVQSEFEAVTAGSHYFATFTVQFSAVNNAILSVDWYNSSSVFLSSSTVAIPSGTSSTWTAYSAVVTAPASATKMKLDIAGNAPTSSSGTSFINVGQAKISTAPALINSITPTSGTDAFGNTYLAGVTTYGGSGGFIELTENGSVPVIFFNPQSVTHQTINPQIFASATNAGSVNEYGNIIMTSGKNGLDDAAIQLFAESADATVPAEAVIEFGGTTGLKITKTGPKLATVPVYHADCSSPLSVSATETDITGATISVVVAGGNSTVVVTGVFDMQTNASANASVTGFLTWNGSDRSEQALIQTGTATANRATTTQTWVITGVTAGTYTAKLRGSGTSGGTIRATHTGITAVVYEGI